MSILYMPMLKLASIALLVALVVLPATAHAADAGAAAAAIRAAATELIEQTPESQRDRLMQPFTDAARSDWHYTPRRRAGVPLKDMSPAQREAGHKLLATALSDDGLEKVRAVFALEIALRELETFGFSRDPENYAFAIYGNPGPDPWGWRIEGHHLSLHFTLAGDRVLATLPQFVGANPAEVPENIPNGPRKGARAMAEEEDRALELLRALNLSQRKSAIFSERSYYNIITDDAEKVDPLKPVGIAFADLDGAQQAQLLRIVEAFASLVEPPLAEQRLERVREGGLESIRFGWAGATERGKAYYYRIQGPTFLIELANRRGNHIHSVWRDFDGDWGRDVLREHYRNTARTAHRH
jgi:hypothetical protein